MGSELKTEPARAGAHGFDTNTKLTATIAKALRKAGFEFAIRYLSRKANPKDKDLTAEELDVILDAGLAVMAVQHVAATGWTPSENLGVEYGANAANHARTIGLSNGSSVWLDLEGIAEGTSVETVIAYCNAWFKEVENAGYTSGVYVGANSILSGHDLYLRLKTKHYWKSGSHVPSIPHRGYCMEQHIIANDKIAGVSIDRNVVLVDAFGSTPMLMTKSASENVALSTFALLDLKPAATSVLHNSGTDEMILRSLAEDNGLIEPMERLIKFRNERRRPISAQYWSIVNFDLRSSVPRMFVFDVENKRVQSYLCAHGVGSEGPTDDGYATVFSNERNSKQSSLGVYECAETYQGEHGYSMRLDGLEPTNSNARKRAVVVHGASYVSPEFIKRTGRIGRSEGCFALEDRYVTDVVTALNGGSLLLAWYSKMSKQDIGFAFLDEHQEIWSEVEHPASFAELQRDGISDLAERIRKSPKIVLARNHSSGKKDEATAYQNIIDTAEGRPAHRSSYGTAPGGVVRLDARMLEGMLALAEQYNFAFSISEFSGGSHNTSSRHYIGCAADINTINGQHVSSNNPHVAVFCQHCRDLGATEILGPGNAGHSTHVHVAWPRP